MNDATDKSPAVLLAPLPWQVEQWTRLSRAFAAKQLAHAYLFSGSAGLGKELFAKDFARYTLCRSPRKFEQGGGAEIACGECANCLKGGAGNHHDLCFIAAEEDSKNIKIGQIRRLSEFVIRSSHSGGAKLAIVRDAHLLNANAANALLKTLEEPNKNTYLFLISDYPGRLVATIRSRCQIVKFANPSAELAQPWLQNILGASNISAVLEASNYRPLIALELAEGDYLQARVQFLQSICEVKLGRNSLQQALALAAKIGESEVLTHLSAFLSTLTKYTLTGTDTFIEDSSLKDLTTLLLPVNAGSTVNVNKAAAANLSHFYLEVEDARRQLASSTNPNPQLVMESILWRWSNLQLG